MKPCPQCGIDLERIEAEGKFGHVCCTSTGMVTALERNESFRDLPALATAIVDWVDEDPDDSYPPCIACKNFMEIAEGRDRGPICDACAQIAAEEFAPLVVEGARETRCAEVLRLEVARLNTEIERFGRMAVDNIEALARWFESPAAAIAVDRHFTSRPLDSVAAVIRRGDWR